MSAKSHTHTPTHMRPEVPPTATCVSSRVRWICLAMGVRCGKVAPKKALIVHAQIEFSGFYIYVQIENRAVNLSVFCDVI